jgi:hypothetical protein
MMEQIHDDCHLVQTNEPNHEDKYTHILYIYTISAMTLSKKLIYTLITSLIVQSGIYIQPIDTYAQALPLVAPVPVVNEIPLTDAQCNDGSDAVYNRQMYM